MAFTYFFRDLQTLECIRDYVLPFLRSRRYIRIWDAGCAMGPEPYSLAIIFRENMGATFRNVTIFATDVDESGRFGEIIRRGVYPQEQVKRIPREVFERYFRENGNPGHFEIAEEIKERVRYRRHDLLSLEPIREDLDLILCKNVLLHFSEEERISVIRMFHEALGKEGFFVTEQTQEMPAGAGGLFLQVVPNARVFRKIG
ncbi:MAG: chemotaxis protein CheR [Deltaproteobacteria bacterium]|nr:chemotaxis protein CheR [Deltaproteobacteria bacterium]